MTATWLRVRSDLRARRGSVIALVLLVGIGGGVAMAAGAGARRTASAYPRFLESVNADHVTTAAGTPGAGFNYALDLEDIAALPEVGASQAFDVFFVSVGSSNGFSSVVEVALMAPPVPYEDMAVNRLIAVDGRLPAPDALDEVAIGFSLARRGGLQVGDTLDVSVFPSRLLDDLNQFATVEPLATVTMDIVGIVAGPGLFPPKEIFWQFFAGPAFGERFVPSAASVEAIGVRLHGWPDDAGAFKRGVDVLAGGAQQFIQQDETTNGVQRSIGVSVVAVTLFGALMGLAVLLIAIQAMARLIFVSSDENDTLQALGFARGQIARVHLTTAATVGTGASVLAIAIAFGLSPLLPQGIAAIAEPSPGLSFDVLVLIAGALLIVVSLMGASAVPAWRAASAQRRTQRRTRHRPSIVVDALVSAGAGPTMVAGARLALERGRGRTATPLWTTMGAAAIGMAALLTAASFDASLDHLTRSPHLFGWNWDALVGNIYGPDTSDDVLPALGAADVVSGYSAGTTNLRLGVIREDGEESSVNILALDLLEGEVAPTMLEGRWPAARDELAVATATARRLGVTMGDTITAVVGRGDDERRLDFTVVGRPIMPTMGADPNLPELGQGVGMTFSAVRELIPGALMNLFPVQYRVGADPASVAAFSDRFPRFSYDDEPLIPTDLRTMSQSSNAPFVVSIVLTVLAAATLAHGLLSSVRRRRRDLATLKTIGFSRRQVRAVIAWQATLLALLSALLALPLGIIGGRWAWRIFARTLGVAPEPVVPPLALAVLVPAAVVLANVIASLPARAATRTKPAEVFRSE